MTLEPTLGIFVERRAREHCKGIHSSSFTLTEPSNGRSPLISPSDVRMYEETQIFREFFKVFPLVFSGEQITNTIDYSLPRKMVQKVISVYLISCGALQSHRHICSWKIHRRLRCVKYYVQELVLDILVIKNIVACRSQFKSIGEQQIEVNSIHSFEIATTHRNPSYWTESKDYEGAITKIKSDPEFLHQI